MSDTVKITELERLTLTNMHLHAELLRAQAEREALRSQLVYLQAKQELQAGIERIAKQYQQADGYLDLETGVFQQREQ